MWPITKSMRSCHGYWNEFTVTATSASAASAALAAYTTVNAASEKNLHSPPSLHPYQPSLPSTSLLRLSASRIFRPTIYTIVPKFLLSIGGLHQVVMRLCFLFVCLFMFYLYVFRQWEKVKLDAILERYRLVIPEEAVPDINILAVTWFTSDIGDIKLYRIINPLT